MADAGPSPDAADALAAKEGDRDAFARLVERHARRVHDLARRMLRDAHEAEDVVQHAFWNAWRARDRLDPAQPFLHWILRIASNLCRNRFAARRRRIAGPAGGGDDPPGDRPGRTEAAPGSAEEEERVRRALEALPERYRLPAVLRYVHDLPLEAIAEITGDGLATVKTHLFRARAALKALLDAGETAPRERGTTGETP